MKNPQDAKSSIASNGLVQKDLLDQPQVNEQSTIVTSSSQNTVIHKPSSYNGIGSLPSGKSYSGIGTPQVSPPPPPPINNVQQTGSAIDLKKRVGMDVLSRFTQRSNQSLMLSVNKVKELKNQYIDTEHVLWGLLHDSALYQLLSECKVVPSEMQSALEKLFKPGNFGNTPQFSPRVKRVLELSLSAARSLGYEFISPEHILLALSHEGEGAAAQVLTKFHLTNEILNQKITGKKELENKEEGKKTSVLELFTEDLTAKASRGELDPVVGRSWEIERIIHILSRRTKNNPVLIGDAGVGKTAIVEGLAFRIAHGDVPETLLRKRILSLDLMSLIAGARHRGEFEERLKNLIKEVKAATGAIILFIDELHNMVGAGSGGEGTMDASNILKPSLARGELQTIGTTTVTEYRKYIEKDPALERRFQPVVVSEPDAETAVEMLMAIRDKYEAFHRVKISDEAIEAAVELSKRYIGDRFLPDKAVDLIDEAAASVRLPAISLPEDIKNLEDKLKRFASEKQEAEKTNDKLKIDEIEKEVEEIQTKLTGLKEQYQLKKSTTTNIVNPEVIAEIVSRWTKIPIQRLTEKESAKLMDLEGIIHKRLINQEDAVSAVSEAVRRGRAGLKSNKRPIGSFIFMGPTGVGKTELAKALAEILFGSDEMMIRIDMTEYMEKHEVAKLIGAPPGYVGYEEGGQLTEAVRRRPYSVVLLDEIEKAHPDVFNILIQLLDDGRLTDNKGHTISFKNTIIICTSNLGSGIIQEEMSGWSDLNQESRNKNQESRIFKTYAVSPTGREILTLGEDYWEKDNNLMIWKKLKISDYFAGSRVIKEYQDQVENPDSKTEFPVMGYDTQCFAPDGSETITAGEYLWFRTSTTVKEWAIKPIISEVKDNVVVNALPDRPEMQLPTAKFDTHAISLDNSEIVSAGDRFWKRTNQKTKDWMTYTLSDYFQGAKYEPFIPEVEKQPGKNQKTEGNLMNAHKQEKIEKVSFPVKKWDNHLFLPNGAEIIIIGDIFWLRKNTIDTFWTYGNVSDLFPIKEVESTSPEPELIPLGISAEKKEKDIKQEDNFSKLTDRLMTELRKFFRPELLNRFDEVVVFKPLTRNHMVEIVDLQAKYLSNLLSEQSIKINISPIAKEFLAQSGFDPIFGARPLRRTMQRLIENPISSLLIKGELTAGDTVLVESDGTQLTFNVKKMEKRIESTKQSTEKSDKTENNKQLPKTVSPLPNSEKVDGVNGQPVEDGSQQILETGNQPDIKSASNVQPVVTEATPPANPLSEFFDSQNGPHPDADTSSSASNPTPSPVSAVSTTTGV
jgi:ATP-dependent Clp protease ATP-binding subunit ClpC